MAVWRGTTPCKRRRSLKRSFEKAIAQAMSLGGSVVARILNSHDFHPSHATPACVAIHDSVLQAIGAVFFRRSRLFVLFHTTQLHPSKPHQIKQPLSKIAVNERAVVNLQSLFSNHLISIFSNSWVCEGNWLTLWFVKYSF